MTTLCISPYHRCLHAQTSFALIPLLENQRTQSQVYLLVVLDRPWAAGVHTQPGARTESRLCINTHTVTGVLIWSTLLHTTAVPYNEQAVIVSTPAIQLTTYYPDMRVWEKLGIQIKAKGLLFCHSASPVASTTHVCKATPDHYALKNRLSRWLCNCAPGRALWPRAQGPAAAPRSPAECRAHLSASTPRVRETCASSAAHRAESGLCAFHCYSARVLLWAAAPGVLCLTQTSCCPNWHAQGRKAGAQSGGGHGTDRTFPAAHFLKWACPPKPQQHSRSPGEALKPSRSPAVRGPAQPHARPRPPSGGARPHARPRGPERRKTTEIPAKSAVFSQKRRQKCFCDVTLPAHAFASHTEKHPLI